MGKPKVSVIVPIYNVEKYIERCVKSLFEQTLDDMEFIFVNDCTPDKSMDVLNRLLLCYPERKIQSKIIEHSRNKGLPEARVSGIKVATGEYIIHCDTDDWTEPGMYEEMYNFAVENDYDYVWCDFQKDSNEASLHISQKCSTDKYDLIKAYLTGDIMSTMWNKMVRASICQRPDIQKALANYMEDVVLTVQYTYYSDKIGYINKPLYHYFYNPESICVKYHDEKIFEKIQMAVINNKLIFDFISRVNLQEFYKSEIIYTKYKRKIQAREGLRAENNYTKYNSIYPEIRYKIYTNKYVSLREKIIALLIEFRLYLISRRLIYYVKN